MKKLNTVMLSILLLGLSAHAYGVDWWRTPEQRAQSALQASDIDQLRQLAPDTQWQGVAEHKAGEFDAAASLFAEAALEAQLEGNAAEANRALYNQGVSEVQAGLYEQAVDTFNKVLEQDPQFADAEHNRDIAQQLIQQQQQQQQQQQPDNQSGERNESSDGEGEQQESSQSGDPSEDQQNSEQGESEEQQDAEQADASGGESGNDEQQQSQSEAQRQQDEQAARDALEAQARAGDQGNDERETDTPADNAMQSQQPLSETEQATEQWLRRIPDDPAGLLRRKLEQSHRSEYPEVRDAAQPW